MLDCTLMLERSARAAIPDDPDDEDFLWRLYVSTRAPEVAAFGWPPEQQEAFLRMQYRARRGSYYTAAYPQRRAPHISFPLRKRTSPPER